MVDCWLSPRCQLCNRIAHGLTKVVHLLSVHPPLKGSTDITAAEPELDILLFVGHRVLGGCESETHHRKWEGMYPYHCQEGTGGAKCGLGWRDARDFFCEIQRLDGNVQ